MKLRTTLILSTLTLALTACGGSEENSQAANTAKASATVAATTTESNTAQEKTVSAAANQTSAETAAQAKTESDKAIAQAETATQKPAELPHGRLNGIVDTGSYKQAIINNAGQVIRLKEGQNWQGWQIKQISNNMIMINSGDVEHQLSLHEDFHAPKLSQAEIDRRNQLMQTQQILAPDNNTMVERTIPPLQLTEEQREIMQSRLIASQ